MPDKNYGDVEVIIENADKVRFEKCKRNGCIYCKSKSYCRIYETKRRQYRKKMCINLKNQSVKEIRRNLENKSEVKTESKTENKAEVKQESIPVQKSENKNISNSVQTLQPTVRTKKRNCTDKRSKRSKQSYKCKTIENIDTVSEKVNTLITEEKSNDTIFD